MIALDFETARIEPGLTIPPPVCLSVAGTTAAGGLTVDLAYGAGQILAAEPGLDFLAEILRGEEPIAGLNVAFDLGVFAEARPGDLPLVFEAYDKDRIHDVGIRQKLIEIALGEGGRRYGLANISQRVLNRSLAKEGTWRLRYWELVHVPLEQWPHDALMYAVGDAVTTLDLWAAQEQGLAELDRLCVLADQYRRARGDFVLRLASAWGLRTDAAGCLILREACESRQAALEPRLLEAGLLQYKMRGRGRNKKVVGVTRKIAAVRQRLLADAQSRAEPGSDPRSLLKLTAKGEISTDKEACEDAHDPLLADYTDYAQLGNLLTGFVKDVEQGTELPIHTHFEILLNTGRTSSSQPNVQNVRRREGARECFVPRDGFVYVACDIDRAELHTLAQVCLNLFGHSTLAESLNAGIDPHTRFGARLAGCTYEELQARLRDGDDEAAALRQRAKPANFGFPGGMGPAGMQRYAKSMYGILLTPEEAQGLHESWAMEYPEIAGEYLPWIAAQVQGTGICTIEHFGSGRWRGGCTYCVAANSFFQGMAADAMVAMLWAMARKCYLPGTALYGCRIVNEVHDEILIEAPRAQCSDAAYEMQETMVEAYNTYTIEVPVRATPVVMDRWSKKAKPLVEDGVYRIWHYRRSEEQV